MTNIAFKLYILFMISFFLRLPARFPVLGVVRFDLLLVGLIFLTLLFQGRTKREKDLSDTPKLLITLIIYILISFPFVRWPGSVLNVGIPNFIKAVIFYYYTFAMIDSERRLKLFIWIFVACQSFRILEPLYLNQVNGYWGDQTHAGGGEMMARLAGAPVDIINSNGLAFVIASVIPFYHYLCLSAFPKLKMIYFALLPLFLYALVLTASRTGLLALGIVLFGIFYKSKRKVLLTAMIGLSALVFFSSLNDLQQERYLSIVKDDVRFSETAKGRTAGVFESFEAAFERPILGHGLGTSREAQANLLGRDQIAHNLYAEIMIELGIIGLIIYILFVKSVIVNFRTALAKIKRTIGEKNFLMSVTNAMIVWMIMNVLFSFASHGLSSYEWYLFAGLSVVVKRLSETGGAKVLETSQAAIPSVRA